METEIKLSPVDAAIASQVFADELLRPHLGDARRSDMESIYYIDKYGLLGKMKAGLRIRQENGEGVCCLKVSRRTEGSNGRYRLGTGTKSLFLSTAQNKRGKSYSLFNIEGTCTLYAVDFVGA